MSKTSADSIWTIFDLTFQELAEALGFDSPQARWDLNAYLLAYEMLGRDFQVETRTLPGLWPPQPVKLYSLKRVQLLLVRDAAIRLGARGLGAFD